MITHEQTMTTSEWEVMRIIWTLNEATSKQIIHFMRLKKNWAPSTVKTLITRLQKKGYLTDNGAPRDRLYLPIISEQEAMHHTLAHTIGAMCAMCVGQSLAEVLSDITLSRDDITQLQSVLQKKLTQAPTTVACDCLPKERITHHVH
ncbi:MAG: CopY/TcrY family copper transport repressor [Leuconostoc carnosum]|uniref:CopY/TcrY family copper transport repressor n=1 Tax=Leuconostoc carnosum TaxID=1252 RepID=UPI00345C942A